jgi:hypothetical protein
MPKFTVYVEKRLYCTGSVAVYAESEEQAIAIIEEKIDCGHLRTTNVEWNEPSYEDCSFGTTGDVD